MPLDIQESRIEDITVLGLVGRLAMGQEGQRVETIVEDVCRPPGAKVIFDMSGVTYIDSMGIGILTMAAGKLKASGGRLVVVTPADKRTANLLTLTQINLLVSVCETAEQARGMFA